MLIRTMSVSGFVAIAAVSLAIDGIEVDVSARAFHSEESDLYASALVRVPLDDMLKIRLAGTFAERSSFIRNPFVFRRGGIEGELTLEGATPFSILGDDGELSGYLGGSLADLETYEGGAVVFDLGYTGFFSNDSARIGLTGVYGEDLSRTFAYVEPVFNSPSGWGMSGLFGAPIDGENTFDLNTGNRKRQIVWLFTVGRELNSGELKVEAFVGNQLGLSSHAWTTPAIQGQIGYGLNLSARL